MAVFVAALYETLAASCVLPSINSTVLELIVEAVMASLKLTVTVLFVATFVVPGRDRSRSRWEESYQRPARRPW